jgi:predicted 3-demethylubiquinone-9 3-methyltransferase (glyoxalase superfamily)
MEETMQKISPFLWFDSQAEEATALYASIFTSSKIESLARYGEGGPGPAGSVMTVGFRLAGQEFAALNGGPIYKFTPAISFFVGCATEGELDALWAKLSASGSVLMELQEYPFSKKYGWVTDRFGLSWQLNLAPSAAGIAPALMFVGPRVGKAEEAIKHYISIFKNSRVEHIERYGPGEGGRLGSVKHAAFSLEGVEFMAMDGEGPHEFDFTPAISFFVNCGTQAEIDELWKKLSAGGSEGRCGWLEDRYGVSWQIVPTILGELLSDPDPAKSGRAMAAMLKMDKLDIAELKKAYEG